MVSEDLDCLPAVPFAGLSLGAALRPGASPVVPVVVRDVVAAAGCAGLEQDVRAAGRSAAPSGVGVGALVVVPSTGASDASLAVEKVL